MEKNAKKTNKKPFLVAGFALLLALIGCVGGVTYSKYISNTSVPSTQATVAKWGYVVTANSNTLFGPKYAAGTNNTATVNPAGEIIVSADTEKSVIAPGATGSVAITVKGNAEVMASLTIKIADGYKDISLSDGANTYNPLKWTAKVGDTAINSAENTTLANVATALSTYSKSFKANETVDTTFTLSYTWAFDGKDIDSGLKNGATALNGDDADTILGKLANGTISASDAKYGYASTWTCEKTVSLSLSATLAQVQA